MADSGWRMAFASAIRHPRSAIIPPVRVHGSDKLIIDGERLILRCRVQKMNWVPRVPKTMTRSAHPGTAVLWDEQFFEVVKARQVGNFFEYTLEPWDDVHMIRGSDRYDDETEQHREVAYRTEIKRRTQRRFTLLVGMFAGHLPTGVQERIGNELGIIAARLTLMSTFPGWLATAICAFIYVDATMKEQPNPIPLAVMLLVWLMLIDSAMRAFIYFSQSRPMGSPFGFVAYAIYYYLFASDRSKLLAPGDDGRGHRLFTLPPPDDVQFQDDLKTWGPALSLLTPAEQKKMEAAGYNYREHAYGLAWIILIVSLIGLIASFIALREHGRFSAAVSMLVAGLLAVEQIFRLTAFSRGPAGSILGVVFRPFVRKLLRRG